MMPVRRLERRAEQGKTAITVSRYRIPQLCQRQLALITFVRKFVNTGLCLLINAKIDELLGDFRSQKRPKRIKKTVEYVSSNHAGMISHR